MIKLIFILFFFLTGCSQNQKFVEINNHKIKIEIADTEIKRATGLSGRKNLCESCGMLFIFDKPGHYGFWMKDMKFPLDFIFINGAKIVDLKENILPSAYPNIITTKEDFDNALEVNSDYISKNEISIGQKIDIDK